jgi:predicted kinase
MNASVTPASALRCHLLIGPPASGKTTLATHLAPLLGGDQGAEVLATDAIRAELYGDPHIQGNWSEIEAVLHERLRACIRAGTPVIVDATHAMRPWRLAITQRLELPAPVEWIGWRLTTPLPTCLVWNQQRERQVSEAVLRRFAAALEHPVFSPSRSEGFAALVGIDPSAPDPLGEQLQRELGRLEGRISAGRNRDAVRCRELHGYSRLLDLERLLWLLQLLARFPDLEPANAATRAELEAICCPLPEGPLAVRAAAFLAGLRGDAYADAEVLAADLDWLVSQGFFLPTPTTTAIEPPPPTAATLANRGGWPPEADPPVFRRLLTLLRHCLKQPFDHRPGLALHDHLAAALAAIPGGYLAGEGDTLRKDVQRILAPYGLRAADGAARHGHALGTAVLSAARLREVHQVVAQAAGRLADPSNQDLLAELEDQLGRGGILSEDHLPVRAFANRSIVHPELVRSDSLATPAQAERLEAAIAAGQRVVIERFSTAAHHGNSPSGERQVWPLQLLFHTIGWYLAYEEDAVGRPEGLIRTERLDRLALRRVETGFSRPIDVRRRSLERLHRLLHHGGGIFLGDDLAGQLVLASGDPAAIAELLETLRFRCVPWVFRFLREGLQRFPLSHTRLSLPLPGDPWNPPPQAPCRLEPRVGDSHPYPLEIDLPPWTLAADVDFRRWLFGFGAGVRIETPLALAEEHSDRGAAVAALYADSLDAVPSR